MVGRAHTLLTVGILATACGTPAAESTADDGGTTDATAVDDGSSDEAGTAADEPSPYDGEPLTIVGDGQWHWTEIDGMRCADGEPSGVGLRTVEGSSKLALYFKGGGACFNATTCAVTGPLMLTGEAASDANPEGILDLTRADNPLADYNIVYVPYCTGDIHSGTVGSVMLDGVDEPWDFSGAANVLAALNRVAPTFPQPEQLAVIGTSAGGLGALANYPAIDRGWPGTPKVGLDDSGLIFRDEYLKPCLQSQMRQQWGLADSLPPCSDCTTDDGGGLANLYAWLADTYPQTRFGLIGANRDEIIRIFYGFGNDSCASAVGLPDLGAELLTEALLDVRDHVLAGRFSTYIIDGQTHTWTTKPLLYTTTSGGVLLRDWVANFLTGPVDDVQP